MCRVIPGGRPFFGIGLKLYQVLSGNTASVRRSFSRRKKPCAPAQRENRRADGGVCITTASSTTPGCSSTWPPPRRAGRDAAQLSKSPRWKKARTASSGRRVGRRGNRQTPRPSPRGSSSRPGPSPIRAPACDPAAQPMISRARARTSCSTVPSSRRHRIMVRHQRRTRNVPIPWHGHTLVGPPTPRRHAPLNPCRWRKGNEFMLGPQPLPRQTADGAEHPECLCRIRPLVNPAKARNTAASRGSHIHNRPKRPAQHRGGKWTTYRNMAEDCVGSAATLGDLADHRASPRR